MTATDRVLGEKFAEGKTKALYTVPPEETGFELPPSALAYMVHKDDITAGDGAKRDTIDGKGELSCRTTSAVFRYLDLRGVRTHYVGTLDDTTMVVQRAEMIPIEWVARRIATGSYVRRTGTAEGTRFEPIVLELFFKDDANHDPQISATEAVQREICSAREVEEALTATERVFLLLEEAWAQQEIQLVDLKIEFGRTRGGLLVADVIDNDSWRLWPGGQPGAALDKQVYRDLRQSSEDALAGIKRRYVEVAERAERLGGAT
jgi:phosphoribosylaminoimidazole-succinocarboxamide synthase